MCLFCVFGFALENGAEIYEQECYSGYEMMHTLSVIWLYNIDRTCTWNIFLSDFQLNISSQETITKNNRIPNLFTLIHVMVYYLNVLKLYIKGW